MMRFTVVYGNTYLHQVYIEIDAWIEHRTLLIENNLLNIYSVSKLNSISWKCILFGCELSTQHSSWLKPYFNVEPQTDINKFIKTDINKFIMFDRLAIDTFSFSSFNEYSYQI